MKDKIIKTIYKVAGFIGLSFVVLFLSGLAEIWIREIGIVTFSIVGIVLGVAVEELFKFIPLWQSKIKIDPLEYLLVLATVFTLFEFFHNHWTLVDLQSFGGRLRLVPHYLFIGSYLLGARENKYLGLGMSTTSHLVWNFAVLFLFK